MRLRAEFETGARALFSQEPPPGEERQRFCAECLPISEARKRFGRVAGPLLDFDVVAIFERRLAEVGQ